MTDNRATKDNQPIAKDGPMPKLKLKELIGLLLSGVLLTLTYNNCSGGFEMPQSAAGGLTAASSSMAFSPADNVVRLPKNSKSDLTRLQEAINNITPSQGLVEISLEPRVYNLQCPEPEVQSLCLIINGKGQIRLKGQPGQTTLLFSNPRVGGIYVNSMERFEMDGIQIDYATPPFIQGTIQNVSGSQFTVLIDEDYPEFNHALFSTDFYQSSSPGSFAITPGTRSIKGDADHWIGLSLTRPRQLGSRTWSVESANPNLSSLLAPGDRYVVAARPNAGSALHITSNNYVAFRDVTIHTAPFFGLFLFGNRKEVAIQRMKIAANPASNRLISTVGDAIHAQNNRASLSITDSHFESMGDDGLNIYTHSFTVKSLDLARREVFVEGRDIDDIAVGDRLQFADKTQNITRYSNGNEPFVVRATREGTGWRLVLDQELSASLSIGDHLFDLHLSSPNSRISGNTYGSFRGSIRLRGVGSVFSGNRFLDPRNERILTTRHSSWLAEGPIATNTILVAQTSPPKEDSRPVAPPPPPVSPPAVQPTSDSETPQVSTPASPAFNQSVYRFYMSGSDSHRYGLSRSDSSGVWEGEAFRLAQSPHSSLAGLYLCLTSSGTHFISRSANCEGTRVLSLLGYVSVAPQSAASRAVIRCRKKSGSQAHLITALASECNTGNFTSEGTLGYVP